MRRPILGGMLAALLAAPAWAHPEPGDPAALAVEVVGDVASADHVAVVVPGAGTHADHLEAIDQPLGMARALVAEVDRIDAGTELAAVAWAGYHAPDGLSVGVLRAEHAEIGAERLDRYLAGLAERTDAPVTLFCHSYGSVVCGRAKRSPNVTDVVLFGSPGAGVATADSIGTRVWAARTPEDWIRFVPSIRLAGLGHGVDPVDAEFGAWVVATESSGGHRDYLAPGTESRRNFARIAVGSLDAVTCAGASADGCLDPGVSHQ